MIFKLALCQMKGHMEKESNLASAEAMLREAGQNGADVVALPEMFNCPYSNKFFREYAEEEGGLTFRFLSNIAKELGIYLVGGSIPELYQDQVYNTCYSFDKM